MPRSSTLSDGDRQLLRRCISVAERAAEAAASGTGTERVMLAQQLSGLGHALEQVRDSLESHAAAYLAGKEDQRAEDDAGGTGRLRLVAPSA